MQKRKTSSRIAALFMALFMLIAYMPLLGDAVYADSITYTNDTLTNYSVGDFENKWGVQIYSNKASYEQGENIYIKITGASSTLGSSEALVGIYEDYSVDYNSSTVCYAYTGSGNTCADVEGFVICGKDCDGRVVHPPEKLDPGTYYIIVVATDGRYAVLPISVSGPKSSMTLEKTRFKVGEAINVSVSSAYANAWVGYYPYANAQGGDVDLNSDLIDYYYPKEKANPYNVLNCVESDSDKAPGHYKVILFTKGTNIDTDNNNNLIIRSFYIEHYYDDPEWTWNEDFSEATATFACVDDETVAPKTVTVSGTAITSTTQDATCDKGERIEYTATVTSADIDFLTYNEAPFTGTAADESGEPLGHSMTPHGAVAATCTAEGNSAYWFCDRCNKYFSDEEGTTEIEEDSWVTEALGHSLTEHPRVDAACESTGTEAYWECTVCHELFADEAGETPITAPEAIPATGHDFGLTGWTWEEDYSKATATFTCANDATHIETVEAVPEVDKELSTAPICEAEGEDHYIATVSFEDNEYSDYKVRAVDALGHKYGEPAYTWSADNSKCTAKMVCEHDATHVVEETVDAVKAETPATCEAAGKTVYTATFENAAFKEQSKEIAGDPALGHKYGEPAYTWSADNSKCTAKMVCENDATHVVEETVDAAKAETPATCGAAGKTIYTAAFENAAFEEQSKEIAGDPALGHKYGEPAYTWSADNSKCTAKMVCENDATHVVEETVDAAKAETPATCGAAGKTVYTAIFENAAFETQTKEVVIEELGHKYGEPEYTWAEDNSTCTAKMVCEHDAAHIVEQTVEAKAETSAATCEAEGKTVYTATFEIEGFETQTKEVETSATGHKWGEWKQTKAPTCTEAGSEERVCENDAAHKETREIAALGHDYKEVEGSAVEPTTTADGKKADQKCSRCGDVITGEAIPKLAVEASLSKTKFHYTGKVQKPEVEVVVNGAAADDSAVELKWSGASKAIGAYTVTVKYKDFEKTLKYQIAPRKIALTKVARGTKSFTAKWKKLTKKQQKNVDGIQIRYSKDKKFKSGVKTVKVSKKAASKTIRKLTKKKKYYVKIRTYKKVKGKTYYSDWSRYRYVTTK